MKMADSRPLKRARKAIAKDQDEPEVVLSLRRLDPILQFLSKATGRPTVPVATLKAALPGENNVGLLQRIPELAQRGVLHVQRKEGDSSKDNRSVPLSSMWKDEKLVNELLVGFPPPPSLDDTVKVTQQQNKSGTLHGSTKTAAKRRLAALKRSLKTNPQCEEHVPLQSPTQVTPEPTEKKTKSKAEVEKKIDRSDKLESPIMEKEERTARQVLDSLFQFVPEDTRSNVAHSEAKDIAYPLPQQAAYAGSNPERVLRYGQLTEGSLSKIPACLLDAFGLERPNSGVNRTISLRCRLYKHQADAINSALSHIHTIVCTGTGSGKSLCFLLPVMAAAMTDTKCTSLVMFPTKALAQDQMTKLISLLEKGHSDLNKFILPGIIDGDTSHSQRAHVVKHCNLIFTNPDTLHAAILPNWKKQYRPLLERVRYVVIDEAHMYDGVFGAHVAMVLSRLSRLCVASCKSETLSLPTFLACSATMSHPREHFRLLCPIPKNAEINVIANQDDGSPCSAKYFFVWNPPIMNINGGSTGRVTVPRGKNASQQLEHEDGKFAKVDSTVPESASMSLIMGEDGVVMDHFGKLEGGEAAGSFAVQDAVGSEPKTGRNVGIKNKAVAGGKQMYRRHAADETALLLAKAVSNNVRCIVFCKTRFLVEWVYERTISALRSSPSTENLVSRVESYRGGYTAKARRSIEQRLFQNHLLGVVGTSALELGVDIGGIDLTLHCGYPTSHNSLLQQAGRAGRGGNLNAPSAAVMICFNSPCEQHIWRHPSNLLSRGVAAPPSLPLNSGLVQSHMLCAGDEFPLTGKHPVYDVLDPRSASMRDPSPDANLCLNDFDLFGSEAAYLESLDVLISNGSVVKETANISGCDGPLAVYKTHPKMCKPWSRVSLRSIEPINYSIVDISHPLQGGKMDVVCEEAVLDTIPYSRVFYHAFPGAIIIHRGKKYEVQSMTRPPPSIAASPFQNSNRHHNSSCNLGAFAKRTTARYFTRPLSTMHITIVKQMERVDKSEDQPKDSSTTPESLAGNGVITVKREVHGYKKISPVTREELSRFEISLPPMEFDTYALWIDTEASTLSSLVVDYDAGVHALSHALLAVAPLFVPCTTSDIDCDHRYIDCTRVMLFDVRAGGAGTCAQLWKCLFRPKGLLHAAVDLLTTCPSCDVDDRYQGGCPACLQSGHCLKFNQHLSRSAGSIIGKQLLKRIEQTSLYKSHLGDAQLSPEEQEGDTEGADNSDKDSSCNVTSPRRRARAKAMRNAKNLPAARERQIVVGRPSWPLDETGCRGDGDRQANAH